MFQKHRRKWSKKAPPSWHERRNSLVFSLKKKKKPSKKNRGKKVKVTTTQISGYIVKSLYIRKFGWSLLSLFFLCFFSRVFFFLLEKTQNFFCSPSVSRCRAQRVVWLSLDVRFGATVGGAFGASLRTLFGAPRRSLLGHGNDVEKPEEKT